MEKDIKICGYTFGNALAKDVIRFPRWYDKNIIKNDFVCNHYYNNVYTVIDTLEELSDYILYTGNVTDLNDCYKKMPSYISEIFNMPSFKGKYYLNKELIKCDFEHKKILNDYVVLDDFGNIIKSNNQEYINKHIKALINEYEIDEDIEKMFEEMILEYEIKKQLIDYMHNIVMYLLILKEEKCSNIALEFAKNYNLNIDIPMAYGIDLDDNNLEKFIEKYLSYGGKDDLRCYPTYKKSSKNFFPIPYTKLNYIINYSKEKGVQL